MTAFSITAQGPCNINGNLNAPQGAVAWVHTHPFKAGEVQTICGALKEPEPNSPGAFRDMRGSNGQPVYPTYDNKPSYPDRELMHDGNYTRSQQAFDSRAYMRRGGLAPLLGFSGEKRCIRGNFVVHGFHD
jgi:hypothetical protein